MSEDTVKITLDGKEIAVPTGAMLIDVADNHNVNIPRFCYHKKLSISANCRMCLVDVEKAPKPMPACATPVMDGMVVNTRNTRALEAQKATMEFLLINHPLDCPICDQGGECELQDVSYVYGQDVSQYTDTKRVFVKKDIGPLINTNFTRCIECTRCVRFGEEIAGMRELGATGRGDTMSIGTYIQKSVDSELSGNIIDICPVGSLTAKPSMYKYRAWELRSYDTIAAHDCVGSNISVHTNSDGLVRVVPKENEQINQTWISDRDRFSYQGFDAQDRCTQPMVNRNGKWLEVSWQEALEEAANEIELVIEKHGAKKLGGLASANSTLEELYLFQKLLTNKGSNNIDHRLFQVDFSGQDKAPIMPWLGMEIEDLAELDATFLVASNLRKEQPMLNHRIRQASLNGANISSLNVKHYESNFDLDTQLISAPKALYIDLALVCAAVAEITESKLLGKISKLITKHTVEDEHKNIAQALIEGKKSCVLLGSQAVLLPDYDLIASLSENLAKLTQSTLSIVAEDSNTAGACLAGCLPHRTLAGEDRSKMGLNALEMTEKGLSGYLLMNIDPDFDSANVQALIQSLDSAESVIVLSPYFDEVTQKVATVFLPIGTFFETSGTRVNCTGQWQSFKAVISPKGESRPGWKVLRVLANVAKAEGFEYQDSKQVRAEVQTACADVKLKNKFSSKTSVTKIKGKLVCFADRGIYSTDQIVRRATSLQKTVDAIESSKVRISSALAEKLSLAENQKVNIKQSDNSVVAVVAIDDSLSEDCLWVPLSGFVASKLGGNNQAISVEAI